MAGAAVEDTLVRILDTGDPTSTNWNTTSTTSRQPDEQPGAGLLHRYREMRPYRTFPGERLQGRLHTRHRPGPHSDPRRQYSWKVPETTGGSGSAGSLRPTPSCRAWKGPGPVQCPFRPLVQGIDLAGTTRSKTRLIILKDSGLSYEDDGALWFRTSAFGDERTGFCASRTGLSPTSHRTSPIARTSSTAASRNVDILGCGPPRLRTAQKAAAAAMGPTRTVSTPAHPARLHLVREALPVRCPPAPVNS